MLGWLARLGMAAAGFLYCLIGFLAVELALGAGGKAADRTGALQELSGEWWGTALLVVIAVGFAGYALWRFAVAALGEKLEASDDGLSIGSGSGNPRAGFLRFLCFTTVELLIGWHSGSENEKEQTAKVLDWPAGRWLVGAFGVGLVCWGIGSLYRGVTRKFKDDLRTEQMSARTEKWVTRIGVIGYLARAVVYTLIGVFFIRAAWQYNPDEAVGLDGALQAADQTFGPLPGVVAAGHCVRRLLFCARRLPGGLTGGRAVRAPKYARCA
jgi:hypothetical protein